MIELKSPIAEYYSASNNHDFNALVALLVEAATVEDEGRTHRGVAEIRLWAEKAQEEYGFTLAPLESKQDGDTVTVATKVSGAFPGSPIDLHFVFRLDGNKISALTIGD